VIFESEKFYEEIKKLIWRLGEYYNTQQKKENENEK